MVLTDFKRIFSRNTFNNLNSLYKMHLPSDTILNLIDRINMSTNTLIKDIIMI